jgi:hypothetical protein
VAGENDTPREKGSPLKTTEAELGPYSGPITLHDASMGAKYMLRRKMSMWGNIGRTGRPGDLHHRTHLNTILGNDAH